nr:hypothetical protein [Kiritimatiellia bacterium]
KSALYEFDGSNPSPTTIFRFPFFPVPLPAGNWKINRFGFGGAPDAYSPELTRRIEPVMLANDLRR